MVEVEVIGNQFVVVGDQAYDEGDTLEVDEEVAETFSDTLRPVDGENPEEGGSGDETPGGEGSEAPLNPADFTVDEFEAELEDGDYSADELDALADAERSGDNRAGVLDSIEDAR